MEDSWEYAVVFKGRDFIVIKGTLYTYHVKNFSIIGSFGFYEKEREEFFIKERKLDEQKV